MMAPKASEELKAKWAAQKAKLKARFPGLATEDLDFDSTRKNEMLTKLQLKTGRTTNELQGIMER